MLHLPQLAVVLLLILRNAVVRSDSDSCGIPSEGEHTLSWPIHIHQIDENEFECSPTQPCGECVGDCNTDDDCVGHLRCFQRTTNSAGASVPNCQISGYLGDVSDFCYDPTKTTWKRHKITGSDNLKCSDRGTHNGLALKFEEAAIECASDGNCGGFHDYTCDGEGFTMCELSTAISVDAASGRHETGMSYVVPSSTEDCTYARASGYGRTGCSSMDPVMVPQSKQLTVKYDDTIKSFAISKSKGVYGCPEGSVHVSSIEECIEASALLGFNRTWSKVGSWNEYIPGCMIGGPNSYSNTRVYWNTAQGGNTHGWSVCRRTEYPTIQPGREGHRLFDVISGATLTLIKVKLKQWSHIELSSYCNHDSVTVSARGVKSNCRGGLIALDRHAKLHGSNFFLLGRGTADSQKVAKFGGAIGLGPYSSMKVSNMTCSNFFAADKGGCISGSTWDMSIHCTHCSFLNNRAIEGGAIDANQNSNTLQIYDSTFQGNSANLGGAMYMTFGRRERLERVVFHQNTAGRSGGAYFASDFRSNDLSLDFLDQLILHIILLPMMCVTIIIAHALFNILRKSKDSEILMARRALMYKMIILIVLFMYTGMSTRLFTLFRCSHVEGVPGKMFLEADWNIECFTGRHAIMLVVGAVFLVVYIVGIPLVMLLKLCRNRKVLHDTHHPRNKEIRQELGGLYLAFDNKYFWWEVYIIIHKMLQTGALCVIGQATVLQPLAGTIFQLIYLLSLLKFMPYASSDEDLSSFVSSLALFLSMLCAIVLYYNTIFLEGDNSETHLVDMNFIGILLISVTTMSAVFELIMMLLQTKIGRGLRGKMHCKVKEKKNITSVVPSDK